MVSTQNISKARRKNPRNYYRRFRTRKYRNPGQKTLFPKINELLAVTVPVPTPSTHFRMEATHTFVLTVLTWTFAPSVIRSKSCTIRRLERGFGSSAVGQSTSILNCLLKGGVASKTGSSELGPSRSRSSFGFWLWGISGMQNWLQWVDWKCKARVKFWTRTNKRRTDNGFQRTRRCK